MVENVNTITNTNTGVFRKQHPESTTTTTVSLRHNIHTIIIPSYPLYHRHYFDNQPLSSHHLAPHITHHDQILSNYQNKKSESFIHVLSQSYSTMMPQRKRLAVSILNLIVFISNAQASIKNIPVNTNCYQNRSNVYLAT